jgi:hypothetical protein
LDRKTSFGLARRQVPAKGIQPGISASGNIQWNGIGHKPLEEYLAFLKKHGAPFDEKYLWD